ncbi:MAG TPA: porin [Tepidisphaeraceae bacterium]|nr:porin [Tepidisphaeraceae bacterium]
MFSGRRKVSARLAGALGVGAGVLGIGSVASAAEPTQQELLEQIKALQAKVEQMEARQKQAETQPSATQPSATQPSAAQPATSQPAEEATTIDTVLRDAERRSGGLGDLGSKPLFQAEGFTAGYKNHKFIIQDAKGDFVLNPNIQFQARYVGNYRSENNNDPDDAEEDWETGMELRRLKFAFDGNVFGPGLTYKFQWATNRTNGQPVLDDAWVRWAMGDAFGEGSKDFAIRVGQFKDPFAHEEITSSKRQLAVDRSMANEVLAGGQTDWVQGVSLIWDDGPEGLPLRAEVVYHDGLNSDNTNFTDTGGSSFFGAANPNWGAAARVEYMAVGNNWKQYDDFSALDNQSNLLVLGAGVSYTEAAGNDVILYTVDAQFETGRLGLYGAYYGAYYEPGIDPDEDDDVPAAGGINDMAFLVQAGLMLTEKWEVFGRYDVIMLDDAKLVADAEDTYSEITVGVNYYIRGHAAKLTIDGVWCPNGVPIDLNGIGLLEPDGDEEQFAIRGQFQLLL